MPEPVRVAAPPERPLLVFDGECNFCRFWVHRWQRVTGDRVDYLPSQDPAVAARFPEIPRASYEEAVQLIETDGRVFRAAHAAFQALAYAPQLRWLLAFYEHLPGFSAVSEWGYALVARNRMAFSRLTRWLWGRDPEPPRYQFVREVFFAGLGLIYLIAFLSLWWQIDGLIGSRGVLPASEFMKRAREYFGGEHASFVRYYAVPTWCWISASDTFLHVLCGLGVLGSGMLVLRIAPAWCALALWSLYLSLTVVGRDFLSFQWDVLLLEAGLLAVFLAPTQWWPRRATAPTVSGLAVFLLRWLLFRLMLESGAVKWMSGDPTWHNLTALQFHYETQPLPTWIGWFAHQAPQWFQKISVLVVYGIEWVLPFFVFGPRRLRYTAFFGFAVLQIWILLTGNFGFFNYLTLVLCLMLLDDGQLNLLFARRRAACEGGGAPLTIVAASVPASKRGQWPRWVLVPFAVFVILATSTQVLGVFRITPFWGGLGNRVAEWLSPFRSLNSYGLFAMMTTTRPEISLEGSPDGEHWRAYEFRFKPGALTRRPTFVAPYQPRLDWQMWFAALGTYRENPWLINTCVRLLEGSPAVLRLLATDPFNGQPPRYLRAVIYDYRFTSPRERSQTKAWWRRERKGEYLPAISLSRSAPSEAGALGARATHP